MCLQIQSYFVVLLHQLSATPFKGGNSLLKLSINNFTVAQQQCKNVMGSVLKDNMDCMIVRKCINVNVMVNVIFSNQ